MKFNRLEYNSAVFLCCISLFLGIGINKIINNVGSDAWISVIFGSLIGLLIIYFMKKSNVSNSILKLIYNFIIFSIDIFLITKLISSIYLNKTPDFIVLFPFLLIIYYSVTKGINTIFRVIGILFFIYLLITIIPVITLVPNINIDYFKPVVNNSWINILLSSIDFAVISTSPLIIFPNLKDNFKYSSYIGASFILLLIFIVIIGNLGVDLAKLYRYPEYMVFKNISLMGFVENIQNILSYLWLICSYSVASITSFNIKKVIGYKGLCFSFIIILLLFCIILFNNYIYTEYLFNYYVYFLGGSLFLYFLG